MKFLSLLVIIAALAACQGAEVAESLDAQQRSVSSIIVDTLEDLKVQMADGWPEYGIPSLAPLEISHKDMNYATGEVFANGEFDDIVVRGLNEFEIKSMEYSLLFSRIRYEFVFASLNVSTQYKADVGAGYHLARDGGAFLALENLRITGQVRYSTGIVGSNNNFRIRDLQVNISVDNVVSNIENLSKYRIMNRKLNQIVEEFIDLTINENTELIADWIDSTVTPICNELIGDRSLSDLLGLITGGGSN
ncbi:uncharacterized protein LOC117565748 [Drosophila albomicans]|uniref:Uncharacterized protein LOC117565748 n=1 Tax=Drosophila albomicans TaxID=7291 RepID=A0A6P8WB22_DROAB|nr:uncharacterized protein LOC117565748 [Drosophila albomicans]